MEEAMQMLQSHGDVMVSAPAAAGAVKLTYSHTMLRDS